MAAQRDYVSGGAQHPRYEADRHREVLQPLRRRGDRELRLGRHMRERHQTTNLPPMLGVAPVSRALAFSTFNAQCAMCNVECA
jgi:hypothetical protein